jgi:hypothetical protein
MLKETLGEIWKGYLKVVIRSVERIVSLIRVTLIIFFSAFLSVTAALVY